MTTATIDSLIAHQKDVIKNAETKLPEAVSKGKVSPLYAAHKIDCARAILQILVARKEAGHA